MLVGEIAEWFTSGVVSLNAARAPQSRLSDAPTGVGPPNGGADALAPPLGAIDLANLVPVPDELPAADDALLQGIAGVVNRHAQSGRA